MGGYSLERFFSAFSINDAGSDTVSSPGNLPPATVELNSHLSLPYQWEQCLDLKTGEIFYIDRRNGGGTKVDPRTSNFHVDGSHIDAEPYNSEEEEDAYWEGILELSDNGSCSSSCSSTEDFLEEQAMHDDADVLVVAGCKHCLTYLMLPKNTDECPKCRSLLLHFSGTEINPVANPIRH